jgi:hypothetical protein
MTAEWHPQTSANKAFSCCQTTHERGKPAELKSWCPPSAKNANWSVSLARCSRVMEPLSPARPARSRRDQSNQARLDASNIVNWNPGPLFLHFLESTFGPRCSCSSASQIFPSCNCPPPSHYCTFTIDGFFTFNSIAAAFYHLTTHIILEAKL